MSGILKIEIEETEEILKELLKQQKEGKKRERLQMLYWLKTRQAETVDHLAVLLGYHRTTISRWLTKYRRGGLEKLLEIKKSTGRKKSLKEEIQARIKKELEDPEGFLSYQEIKIWIEAVFEINVCYTTVHKYVRYQLKSKLKVPRPVNVKQNKGAVEKFKSSLAENLISLIESLKNTIKNYKRVRYWCTDESRIGLMTLMGRKITLPGVQPIGIEQWKFEYLWLYGLVEPKSGESFFYEFSHLDSICFEKYLELFSEQFRDEFHVIQLDNGAFHQTLNLSIPENVVFLFQPPYSPQVNPIERFWKDLKKAFKWHIFFEMEELREALDKRLKQMTPNLIASLTGWQFILDALSVANI
ncbi:MAG: IS630 family transposase [Waterburya sp.]